MHSNSYLYSVSLCITRLLTYLCPNCRCTKNVKSVNYLIVNHCSSFLTLWIVLAQRWCFSLSSHFLLLLPPFPSDSFTLVQYTFTKPNSWSYNRFLFLISLRKIISPMRGCQVLFSLSTKAVLDGIRATLNPKRLRVL